MSEPKNILEDLSPEKQRLLELLLAENSNTGWARRPYEAPQGNIEDTLAAVWSSILGIPNIGRNDNYFELGGDSIQCIQIMTKARRAGIRITTAQLFERPTIAQLAQVAHYQQSAVTSDMVQFGPAPLSPAQYWFFTLDVPGRNHWNQAILLETTPHLDRTHVRDALQTVWDSHHALRSRFHQTTEGWVQEINPPGELAALEIINLADLDDGQISGRIREAAVAAQQSLDLSAGPVARAVFFDAGQNPGYLFFVSHHLVADAVSFRIIAEDLNTLLTSLRDAKEAVRVEQTTSWREWCLAVAEYSQSEQILSELSWWSKSCRVSQRLPRDFSDGVNYESDAKTYTVALSAEHTQSVFQHTLAALHIDINDALLTALVCALLPWSRSSSISVDIEGHGREDFNPHLDVSRTVGWFTSIYPVEISAMQTHWRDILRTVKETLRAVPRRGFGYGLLRQKLSGQPDARPKLAMNYLGVFDRVLPADAVLRPVHGDTGSLYDPAALRAYELQIVSRVIHGRLETDWIYSERLHSETTIMSLANRHLGTLIEMRSSESSAAVFLTPSDFPDAELSQLDLERILKS